MGLGIRINLINDTIKTRKNRNVNKIREGRKDQYK